MTYRPEIDGLRALAVLGVLFFHFDIALFSGGFIGVDVFFVISGYLICGLMLREIQKEGCVDLVDFWARRFRRLMPTAAVVIVCTLCFSMWLLPAQDQMNIADDGYYSALYVINWSKYHSAVEYFESGDMKSPLLHYWSLAVEEQFYLILTFLVLAVQWSRWSTQSQKKSLQHRFALILLVVVVLSFFASFWSLFRSQPEAFFGSHARLWQLGGGGLIAYLELKKYRFPAEYSGAVLGFTLAVLLAATVWIDHEINYPGLYALVPSLSTALLLLVGVNRSDDSYLLVYRILAIGPLRWIGKISYSLYLWHWPVVVFVKHEFSAWGVQEISIAASITVILSIASYFVIEHPIRRSAWLSIRPLLTVFLALIVTVAVVFFAKAMSDYSEKNMMIYFSNGGEVAASTIRNDLSEIYREPERGGTRCHKQQDDDVAAPCVFGDSERSIHLLGDSHAAHWFPALLEIARENDLKLVVHTKASCSPIEVRSYHQKWNREYTECSRWLQETVRKIEEAKPWLVVMAMMSSKLWPMSAEGELLEGEAAVGCIKDAEEQTVRKLRATGAYVVLMADTPLFKIDPISCLLENPKNSAACTTEINGIEKRGFPWAADRYDDIEGVSVVDMRDQFCDSQRCYSVRAGQVMFRDKSHVASSYSKFIAPVLAHRIGVF